MNERTRAKALDALEGMRQIVRREMLMRGDYVDNEVSNPRLSGGLCGGRKHCAIGSLWAGSGIRPVVVDDNYVCLPGVDESDRPDFLRHRPGLRLALETLNEAAGVFAASHNLTIAGYWDDAIEGLFEGYYHRTRRPIGKRELLKVISDAKRKIKAAQ